MTGSGNLGRRPGTPRLTFYPVKISLLVSDAVGTQLDTLADRYGLSVSELIRQCIDSDLPRLADRLRKRRG